ncbi:hypothetical protein HMI54_014402 [Coelomomyces lativittatus]|nr:hypothetical protein HMI56_002159 [Coelomomyces lativittatus]KAJ1514212.1 hypothetical protein HMI54_014402 [Coelomomyces lativittatus]
MVINNVNITKLDPTCDSETYIILHSGINSVEIQILPHSPNELLNCTAFVQRYENIRTRRGQFLFQSHVFSSWTPSIQIHNFREKFEHFHYDRENDEVVVSAHFYCNNYLHHCMRFNVTNRYSP